MALFNVLSSVILLVSLEELRSSAGFNTVAVMVANVPTMPITITSSNKVKPKEVGVGLL